MAAQPMQMPLGGIGIIIGIIVIATAPVVLHRPDCSTAIGWGLLRRRRSHCSRWVMSSIITAAASATATARLTSLVGRLLVAHHGGGRW